MAAAPLTGAAGVSRAIVLIGFMGAGKSSAARGIAADLGVHGLDSDTELEERMGMSVAQAFERHGEAFFREQEEAAVCELLDRAAVAPERQVVALGGGALGSERVRGALERHLVALLDVDAETAWQRASNSARERPLANDRDAFMALHRDRAAVYERLADAFLPADREAVRRAVESIVALERAPRGTRMVWATSASGDYPAYVAHGLLGSGFWPSSDLSARRYVVTDDNVGPRYAAALEPAAATITVPAGEEHKTLASAERVLRALAGHQATREDVLVALGGGVVGDLGGFVAATYQRGMRVVQVPTTLVAQVDSAYGGKTAVDLPEGKNYIGVYHQPTAVLADPLTLRSLPAGEIAAGYAEVVKTALIAGGRLWDRVRDGAEPDDDVIIACARCKLAVVAEDERDEGRRQVLNLGHTIGHAIETATGYERYRHGEAVALGLLVALRLSGLDALRAEVAGLLALHGLPVRLEGTDPAAVVALTWRDKKRVGVGPVPFVLLDAPGEPRIGCEVETRDALLAVTELAG